MKKKLMSLIMLFGLSLSFVSGCKKNDESVVESLNLDGKDVVLKVGNKTYSADELFGDMLSTTTGAEEIYNKVLRTVVESTIDIDPDMEASWDLLLDSFEVEVETYAATNGVSKNEAKNQLLAEQGYASIEEKKDAYFYEVRLNEIQDKFWDERQNYYADLYFDARLPYYVKHVLVKTGFTSSRAPYSSVISSDDATDLYDVYDMLANLYDEEDKLRYKFSYIMNEKSEDPGSNNTGYGYYMDLTTSFVTEFLHGVYMFDAMLKGETDEIYGLNSDVTKFYTSTVAGENEYGFGYINASDIISLGGGENNQNATSTLDNNITICKDGMEKCEETSTIYTAYDSSSTSLYSRSIIFNQTFNNAAINVIAYDLEGAAPKNTKTIKIDGVEKKVLTDENGNIVFVVCARGDSSDLWVHFLTVNVSPFDADAKLFFSRDQEATIKKMVADYKADLVEEGLTGEELDDAVEEEKERLEAIPTYVDIKGGESVTARNTIIEELEGYIRAYANGGSSDEEEKYLTYEMLDYYMGTKIKLNEKIESILRAYIDEQRALKDLSVNESIKTGWKNYYALIDLYNSTEIKSKRIPMECSYVANGDSDSLCRYTYKEGFFIKLTLDVNGGDEWASDSEWKNKYYQIGQKDAVVLPTPTRTGYTFDGWYTTATDTDKVTGVLVGKGGHVLNTSRTSSLNKTKLYARWTEGTGGNA